MTTEQHTAVTPIARPYRRAGIDEYFLNDEAVLYDPARHATHYLNTSARMIWARCDGRRTVAQITSDVLDEYEMNDPKRRDGVARDVESALLELSNNGLIDLA